MIEFVCICLALWATFVWPLPHLCGWITRKVDRLLGNGYKDVRSGKFYHYEDVKFPGDDA
jgi:hypothetical protein